MAGALTDVLGEVLVAADGEEVAVSALAARGVSLVGLYFGCSLGGPCAQLGASLAAFYGRFRGEAAAAGGQRLEIVFVSAEQEQQQWQEAVRAMPWLALPFADKHRKVRPAAGRRAAGRAPGFVWGPRGSAGAGRLPESSRGEVAAAVPRGDAVSPGSCGAWEPRGRGAPGWASWSVRAAGAAGLAGPRGGAGLQVRCEGSSSSEPRHGHGVTRVSARGNQTLAWIADTVPVGSGVGLGTERSRGLRRPWEDTRWLRSE